MIQDLMFADDAALVSDGNRQSLRDRLSNTCTTISVRKAILMNKEVSRQPIIHLNHTSIEVSSCFVILDQQ